VWRENPVIYPVLENFFEYTAGETISYIMWLAMINVAAITVIEQAPS